MQVANATETGRALCRALGIDPHPVRSVTIRCHCTEVPTATVEVVLTPEQVAAMEKELTGKGITVHLVAPKFVVEDTLDDASVRVEAATEEGLTRIVGRLRGDDEYTPEEFEAAVGDPARRNVPIRFTNPVCVPVATPNVIRGEMEQNAKRMGMSGPCQYMARLYDRGHMTLEQLNAVLREYEPNRPLPCDTPVTLTPAG